MFEAESETRVRVTDNNQQINEVYVAPEPVINVSYSNDAFIGTTATSVLVWKVPGVDKEVENGSGDRGAGRSQWILEP